MERNLSYHIAASSFRDIVHFIHAGFTSGSNTFYEKRLHVQHSLRMIVQYSCKFCILREATLTVTVKKTFLSPTFFR